LNGSNEQTNTNEIPEIEQESNIPGGSPFGWPSWWSTYWSCTLYEAH
jgi:hypothetical protein